MERAKTVEQIYESTVDEIPRKALLECANNIRNMRNRRRCTDYMYGYCKGKRAL